METKKILRHNLLKYAVFILLLVSVTLPVSVASDGETGQSLLPTDYIKSIIDNTPATNPELIKQAASGQNTVAVSGTIPTLPKGEESYHWNLILQNILKEIHTEDLLASYHWDNGGFIIGYGCTPDYIEISVHSEAQYSDSEVKKVIQAVQSAGEKHGISDVPIIIEKSLPPQGYAQTQPDAVKTIPGVGLGVGALLVIAAVLIVSKFKK
ncbi:hypothetical protein MmiAt1_01770 [Methanimicrococcus sp. At1]|uniref:Uncharacterized protein n=1 Tax=Methanimicrococcus hacksteinii TaxID=3028293 RepID=A0ABU3VML4_9EURY|nr:hypothetical protein [Methanimicrococcus sp. At1]MDV0444645.1 hypothetical protein [Methanimicrococcus sp. At1]